MPILIKTLGVMQKIMLHITSLFTFLFVTTIASAQFSRTEKSNFFRVGFSHSLPLIRAGGYFFGDASYWGPFRGTLDFGMTHYFKNGFAITNLIKSTIRNPLLGRSVHRMPDGRDRARLIFDYEFSINKVYFKDEKYIGYVALTGGLNFIGVNYKARDLVPVSNFSPWAAAVGYGIEKHSLMFPSFGINIGVPISKNKLTHLEIECDYLPYYDQSRTFNNKGFMRGGLGIVRFIKL